MRKFLFTISMLMMLFPVVSYAFIQGIYITQPVAENRTLFLSIMQQAQAVGINTVVVDVSRQSRVLQRNIQLIPSHGLNFVARIVMFPHGGSHNQITNQNDWEKKFNLAKYAIHLGAQEIQLDYIRYNTAQPPSPENARYIKQVIAWFKQRLAIYQIPLEIAVFGETAYKPSKNIGQNLKLFADQVDVIAPMLYPSHFEPYLYYSNRPYLTVYDALLALRNQFDGELPIKVYAYIETSNYRYKMSSSQRIHYIRDQIRAVHDAKVDGWYAWSANNKYYYLFKALS